MTQVRLVQRDAAPRADHHQAFIGMLDEMRFGALSSQSIQRFEQLSRPIEYEDGLVPTKL